MAKKGNFKELLLKKGEKIVLFAALGLLVLFVIWGVATASGSADPAEIARGLKSKSSSITQKLSDKNEKPAELPEALLNTTKGADLVPIQPETFRAAVAPFEPTVWPSLRRENPKVLAPTEGQINYVQGSVKIFDRKFTYTKDGQLDEVKHGWVYTPSKVGDVTPEKLKQFLNDAKGKQPPTRRPTLPVQGGGVVPGMQPGSGAEPGRGPMGSVPGQPVVTASRADTAVKYLTEKELAKEKTANIIGPALTVRPVRMAIVQTDFPLRAQLEEIRKALRLKNLADAINESSGTQQPGGVPGPVRPAGVPASALTGGPGPVRPGPGGGGPGPMGVPMGGQPNANFSEGIAPVFEGIVVMRREIPPSGKDVNGKEPEWMYFDHEGTFWDYFVMFDAPYVQESDPFLPYFLRPEQLLASPLPVIAEGMDKSYPPNVQLASIWKNYQTLKAESASPKAADEMKKRFQRGAHNPYQQSQFSSGGGQFAPGYGQGEGMRGPTIGQPPPRPMGSGPSEIPPMTGTGTGTGNTKEEDLNKLRIESLLLRFVDPTVRVGYTYEYKIRVKMKNPNFGRPELMANETDAKKESLEGEWFTIPQTITIPRESYIYAGDIPAFEKTANDLSKDLDSKTILEINEITELNNGRRAVVQIQQWYEEIILQSAKEPVGSWLIANIPVTPGEYIGRKTSMQIPLWSAGVGSYTFRSLTPDIKTALGVGKTTKDAKGYFIVDFRTRNLLVDFTGGKAKTRVGTVTVTDEANSELVILREDGKIEVRREANDTAIKERKERETILADWLKQVGDRKDAFLGQEGTGGTGTGPRGPRD